MGKHRRGRQSQTAHARTTSRRKPLFLMSLGCGLVLAGVGAYFALSRPLNGTYKGEATKRVVFENPLDERDRTTCLLLGTDNRRGEPGGNSDVILVCSLDNKNKRIEIMSIPRDTKVMFPNGTYGKMNEGLQVGGPVMMENLVETLLHIPVDKYALTHFGGLVDVINTLGGITVKVPERMYYNTGDKEWNLIDLKPGVQTLNGTQALGFVRYRHDSLGDVGRTMRQQEFLTALAHQLLQPQNIRKLPTLISQISKTIETDMSLLQISSLAAQAGKFQGYQIIHETLPGAFHDPSSSSDPSYWIVNPEQAKYVSEQFFFEGKVQKNPIQSEESVINWKPSTSSQSSPASITESNSSLADGAATASTVSGDSTDTVTKVSGKYANIRTGPGMEYETIGSVLHGQTVWIEERQGEWSLVKTDDGREGFIANWLLEPPDVKSIG